LKKIKRVTKSFHCQDFIGRHGLLKCEYDYISLRGEAFSDESGISCCAIRFEYPLVVTGSFLPAHVREISEVTDYYCRYFFIWKGMVSM
jgi:hypothetical protein